jgi:hypothetical protein
MKLISRVRGVHSVTAKAVVVIHIEKKRKVGFLFAFIKGISEREFES